MKGLLLTVEQLLRMRADDVVSRLSALYPEAEDSQVRSWHVLANDVLQSACLSNLPSGVIIGFEFALPTDDMAVDLLVAGKKQNGQRVAFLVESKQWSDDYIFQSKYTTYRSIDSELHPQIQVERHSLSFRDYLDVGPLYEVHPLVFLRNASALGLRYIENHNPRGNNENISLLKSIDDILNESAHTLVDCSCDEILEELRSSSLKPCKSIFEAMKSIVTSEEPFVLTKEQLAAIEKVRDALAIGKKVIRIVGPAGCGKTAILLNLYVAILACSPRSGRTPIFISGRQNTALYRSVYPQASGVFSYPCTLERTIVGPNASKFIVLMDEAQHNDEGVVTQVVERGATVILCYDPYQVVSANNPIAEFVRLESRADYVTVHLSESVRYSGSQVAEPNIKTFLSGGTTFQHDDKFDFRVFNDFGLFDQCIFDTIRRKPNATLAVVSQLKFAPGELPSDHYFCSWGHQSECQWVPYVRARDYLNKYNGRLWVGTWWLPGLDIDYVAVIIGDDLTITASGPMANLSKNKLFKPAVALGQKLGVPAHLIVSKIRGYHSEPDYIQSASNIINFLRQPGQEAKLASFQSEMTELLRNNYWNCRKVGDGIAVGWLPEPS